jgi:formate hydrogenlyase transcriptional activator
MNLIKEAQADHTFARSYEFRGLLQSLSQKLRSTSAIEPQIDSCLKAIADFWSLDWIYLVEASSGHTRLQVTHSYCRPGAGSLAAWNGGREVDDSTTHPEPPSGDELRDMMAQNGLTGDNEIGEVNGSLILQVNTNDSSQTFLMLSSPSHGGPCSRDLLDDFQHFGCLLADHLERKKRMEFLDEILRFDSLLSEVSATYINLPAREIEPRLKQDFGRLGHLLRADRFSLYLLHDNRTFRLDESFAWWPHEDNTLIAKIEREDVPTFGEYFRYFFDRWLMGESVTANVLDDIPDEGDKARQLFQKLGVKSYLSIPITMEGATVGALSIATTRSHRTWSDDLIPRLRLFGEVFVNAMMRKRSDEKLVGAFQEIKMLKEQLEADYRYLREEIKLEYDYRDIVGKSAALKRVLGQIEQVAPTDATVLLLGETGTGKGVAARAIHDISSRKSRPFMQVNCAALTPTLIESELFGYEKGAFTGAQARRLGRFELAHGTSLLLDEIGELPPELQAKLLRVLQDGEFERVGGATTIKTNVRLLAATNKDLEREVEAGRFRQDLWYRLNVFPIFIPPLRDRLEDIPLFLDHFVAKYGRWIGKKFNRVPMKAIRALQSYSWPGNIRELENLVERAVITSPDGNLRMEIPNQKTKPVSRAKTMREFEREYIIAVLEDTDWRINGRHGAASRLAMHPSTLRFRMHKLGIKRPSSPLHEQ